MNPAHAPVTVLGNRDYARAMPNFDACKMADRPGDELVATSVFKNLAAHKYTGAPLLVIEVLRIRERPAATFPELEVFPEKKRLREYEDAFMKEVYPLRNPKFTYLFVARADDDNRCYVPEKPAAYTPFARLPKPFEYIDYTTGIFAYNADDDFLPVSVIYHHPKLRAHEQVWMRVWHKQVWDGFINIKAFPPTLLSDECLVHTALELDLPRYKVERMTRNEIWTECAQLIVERYFKDAY